MFRKYNTKIHKATCSTTILLVSQVVCLLLKNEVY